ncbi:hypothetical protein [Paraburkholderia graminis]|uniref:hypothetical protein n=1 Tax=Paraburkholderia graminis TaxID=60548 RepID=UPI0027D7D819|nr:hypothetical protein [Paraburkholderia graminis]
MKLDIRERQPMVLHKPLNLSNHCCGLFRNHGLRLGLQFRNPLLNLRKRCHHFSPGKDGPHYATAQWVLERAA